MKIQVSSTKGEVEDLYPSFIAVSWHGPNYDLPLRQRVKGNKISRLQLVYFYCLIPIYRNIQQNYFMILECNQFLEFLGDLRFNNNNIPLLVGGDFNMDMKVIAGYLLVIAGFINYSLLKFGGF